MKYRLLIPLLLFASHPVLCQTRIEPPSMEVSGVPSNSSERGTVHSQYTNASVPIPEAWGFAMPFFRWQERDDRTIKTDGEKSFSTDRRLYAGLLHHPAEGAPEWKIELGRQGDFQSKGQMIGVATYNLEKPLPFLRPDNSDKLDAWIAVSAIRGNNGHVFALPELAWTWRELSSGLVLDFIAPTAVRMGYHQNRWTATMGARQNWIVVREHDSSSGFYLKPQRLLVVEASRDLMWDFSATFIAGLELHDTSAPYVGFGFGWTPRL